MDECWLRCEITPGQFTGEFAVNAVSHQGTPFSLFAWSDALDCSMFPADNERAAAWIRVEILQRRENLVLVRLPQSTLEKGDTITVNVNQLRRTRVRQEA